MRRFHGTKRCHTAHKPCPISSFLVALATAGMLFASAVRAAVTPEIPPECRGTSGSTRAGCSTLDLIQSPSLTVDPALDGVVDAVLDVEERLYRGGGLVCAARGGK